MKINDIISLEGNERYIILEKLYYDQDSYLFAVKLNENNEYTIEEFKFFHEVNEQNDIYVEEVLDKNINIKLTSSLGLKYIKDINVEQDA